MIKGYTYINLSLFPVYVNDSHSTHPYLIGVQRYNSSQWTPATNNQDLDNLHKIVRLNEDNEEDQFSNYYSNFQFITDLFDVIMTKKSIFRNTRDMTDYSYIIRNEKHMISIDTNNRYTARFIDPKISNEIILLSNPASQNCKTLFKKRQRLNEYL